MPIAVGYWFPAKRYGWGWGPPVVWQGWAVIVIYVAVVLSAAVRLRPQHPVEFVVTTVVASAAFVLVCYAKGEPPQWRWGD